MRLSQADCDQIKQRVADLVGAKAVVRLFGSRPTWSGRWTGGGLTWSSRPQIFRMIRTTSSPGVRDCRSDGSAAALMSLPDSSDPSVERLRQVLEIATTEERNLLATGMRLFSSSADAIAKAAESDPAIAERIEAFVARFSRFQDPDIDAPVAEFDWYAGVGNPAPAMGRAHL